MISEPMVAANPNQGLYIFLLSIHGLVRGEAPELGRDADTGGQVTYVLELARALSEHPGVGVVELLTRQIEDDILSAHQVVHRALLTDVGDVDADTVFDPGDVEQVAAVLGDQGIDDQYLCAEVHELVREGAADKPQAARNHHAAITVERAVVGAVR